MTNQQILTRAIEKAVANGWEGTPFMNLGSGDWLGDPPTWEVMQPFNDPIVVYTSGGVGNDKSLIYPEHIIFNHDFAKALWGNDSATIIEDGCDTVGESWQSHLQQMVIAEDPVKYLGEHL